MGALTKDRLIFDPADTGLSDNIGSYLRAGSDGDLLTSTLIGAKESLDVNIAGSTGLGIYAEDDAHVSGYSGQFILAVRRDADTTMVSADGDYSPLQVDENGRLKVVADIEVANGFEKAEDDAHVSGDIGSFSLGVSQATLASSVSADGDYAAFKVNSRGALWTAPVGTVADDAADTENPVKVGSRAVSGALAAVSATGDRADLLADMYRRVWINDSPNIASLTTVVTAGLTEVALPATNLAGRRRMFIQNTSDKDMFIGPTGVLTTTGFRIAKGATLSLEIGQNIDLFVITTAAAKDVVVFELA